MGTRRRLRGPEPQPPRPLSPSTFEPIDPFISDGEAADEEKAYSRSVVMGQVSGRKSLVDMRNRACGVANVGTGPGGDCALS